MAFRNDRDATRARIEELERDLEHTRRELVAERSTALARTSTPAPLAAWIPAAIAFGSLLLFGAAFYAGFVVSGSAGEAAGLALGVVATLGLMVALLVLVLSRLLVVPSPNELAVLSGRAHRSVDGTTVGFRVVREGRAIRLPLVERLDTMDLGNHEVLLELRRCHARGGALVTIEAVANAKIHGGMPEVARAIERFLGRDREEVTRVARQTLEGAVRGVVAQLTLEELQRELQRVSELVQSEAHDDFDRLGLELDTFRVTKVEPA